MLFLQQFKTSFDHQPQCTDWSGPLTLLLVVAGCGLTCWSTASTGWAEQTPEVRTAIVPVENENERFVKSGVAEILSRRCLSCHNAQERKGDFSLQTASDLMDSGMLAPGDAASSHLLDVITPQNGKSPRMPKGADPLSAEEVESIRNWINAGAVWPAGLELAESQVDNFDWWSLKPLQAPQAPNIADDAPSAAWQQNPIDAFILAKLHEQGLTPSPPADRRTLIRRVTYDLTGLPPSPEEIAAFLADDSPTAYVDLVERLLASPHYGEHWARHWLDVVKYADTCGYDKDKLREHAWPYRDYVIRAFNQDKNYTRFIREQIAGDILFPGEPDGILGLGFLAAGPWDFIGHVEVSEAKLDGMEARNLDRDEIVSNVMNTFVSQTVQCARCHHHKFDPITQEHYYGLQAIFAAVDRANRAYDLDPQLEQQRRKLVQELAEAQRQQRQLEQEIQAAGGDQLKHLNAEIERLRKLASPQEKPAQHGYHSQIAQTPDVTKWVQVDLGQPREVHAITLHPCHDDFAGIGAGFGFPVRYQIWGGLNETDFDEPGSAERIVDLTNTDQPNPGLAAVSHQLSFPDQPAKFRYIRVVVTKLVERKQDYIFALAELVVTGTEADSEMNNLARGASVTALDSIEAPVRWGRQNLTDGIWPTAQDASAVQQLAEVTATQSALLAQIETSARVQQRQSLAARVTQLQQQLSQIPTGKLVYAATTHFPSQGNFKATQGRPRTVHVLHRGNLTQPREQALPGSIPLAVDDPWRFALPDEHAEGERRATLAKWITAPANPLTWRSIVNRIWLAHFGEGLVGTPNDFGRMGQLPTHPELLDWLAIHFRDGGEIPLTSQTLQPQSFKDFHRLIVLSATYQQASDDRADAAEIDASNRWLWRMNRRRLTAEEIRDSILAISGALDATPGGPGDRLFVLQNPEHSPHYEYHLFDPRKAERHRRSVYRFVVRSQPDPWMTVLDCADSSQSTPKRSETLTALQALSLMNNDFNLYMAERFTNRLQQSAPTLREQLQHAGWLVCGRDWNPVELDELYSYATQHGLENTCRVLLNLSEFVFID